MKTAGNPSQERPAASLFTQTKLVDARQLDCRGPRSTLGSSPKALAFSTPEGLWQRPATSFFIK